MYYLKRFSAAHIDYLIVGFLLFPVFYYLFYLNTEEYIEFFNPFFINAVILIAATVYFTIMEYYLNTTIGKKLFRMNVYSINSNVITFKQVLIRNILKNFDYLLFVGVLMIIFGKEKQRIGDILAKTRVLEKT